MRNFEGKVIAITGAGSGIGRALALEFAEHGARLAISDVDQAGLEETRQLLTDHECSVHIVDVSDRDAIYSWADDVVRRHGVVDVIINNAGVSANVSIEDARDEDLEWVVNINLWGVIHGVRAFLPHLRQRPEASIVNLSSLNAFVPFPRSAPYNTSKYGVAGFTESLMQELQGSSIAVTCVHPGGIKTNIVRSARHAKPNQADDFDKIAITTAKIAARKIVKGVRKKKRRLFVGIDAHLLSVAKRMLPMTTVRWAGFFFRQP